MPSTGMPIGNSRIPRPLDTVAPTSPQHTSKNMAAGHFTRMRYRPADAIGAGLILQQPHRSPSQPIVQSWYSSKGQSSESRRLARTLAELESLLQRISSYNSEDADLGRFGSVLRLPERKAGAVLSPHELLKLPGDLRSASRAAANTIAKLKNGEQTHPIECNFGDTEALLNRLDDLQPSLPKLANAALRLSSEAVAKLSPPSPNSLDSCDLSLRLDSSSAGSSPSG